MKMNFFRKTVLPGMCVLAISLMAGCAGNKNQTSDTSKPLASDKGIGPVTEVILGELDSQKASAGQQIFQTKCSACHKIGERYVGPDLLGVTKRRKPEWIMNMILNPAEMTQKDPVANDLLANYLTQMTFQNVTQDEVRSILEFFRQNDAGQQK